MKKADKTYSFKSAFQSFSGFLVGTHKSVHTVKNYQVDLRSFERYMNSLKKGTSLTELTKHDLERYHEYLKTEGLRANTRRRKLLTARKFLGYLTRRGKVELEVARRIPAPARQERIPAVVPYTELLRQITSLKEGDPLLARNRVLLWTLLETGAQVSELAGLCFDQWRESNSIYTLEIRGKRARTIPVSQALFQAVKSLRAQFTQGDTLFRGHNRYGASHLTLSPRGIELTVKELAPALGFPDLVPRTFRHSAVLHWHQTGVDNKTIRARLGLQSDYAFRVYDALFELNKTVTS